MWGPSLAFRCEAGARRPVYGAGEWTVKCSGIGPYLRIRGEPVTQLVTQRRSPPRATR